MTTRTPLPASSAADLRPTTEAVLRLIGKDGVVVGSFADEGASSKDIDLVVRPNRSPDELTNLVFQRVREQFSAYCESSAIGHLWVDALPLPVELFATTAWRTGDPEKDARRILFPQARRRSRRKAILGVELFVYTGPA